MKRSSKASCLLVVLTAFCAAALAGCIPYYGRAQKRVPRNPITLVDAKTSQPIDTVLLIPRYSSFSGISSGGGHGPGISMSAKVFIAHPFLYHRGDSFAPLQTKAKGVITLLPETFFGSGSTLDGVVVIAPGYKPLWVWDFWFADAPGRTLTPIAETDARRVLQDLSQMIARSVLSEAEKETFSYSASDAVYVRLTDADRQVMRAFIAEAMKKLPRS